MTNKRRVWSGGWVIAFTPSLKINGPMRNEWSAGQAIWFIATSYFILISNKQRIYQSLICTKKYLNRIQCRSRSCVDTYRIWSKSTKKEHEWNTIHVWTCFFFFFFFPVFLSLTRFVVWMELMMTELMKTPLTIGLVWLDYNWVENQERADGPYEETGGTTTSTATLKNRQTVFHDWKLLLKPPKNIHPWKQHWCVRVVNDQNISCKIGNGKVTSNATLWEEVFTEHHMKTKRIKYGTSVRATQSRTKLKNEIRELQRSILWKIVMSH